MIVASVATLGRRIGKSGKDRLSRFDPADFKLIVIDEAHHSPAVSYMRIIEHFVSIDHPDDKDFPDGENGVTDSDFIIKESSVAPKSEDGKCFVSENDVLADTAVANSDMWSEEEDFPSTGELSSDNLAESRRGGHIMVWGCSATLSRRDDLALEILFEEVIYHKQIGDAIKEGWLVKPVQRQVYTDIDLDSVPSKRISTGSGSSKSGKDFDLAALSLAIDTPSRNKLVATTWYDVAWKEMGRRSTIVFALNVQHAKNLAKSFETINLDNYQPSGGEESDVSAIPDAQTIPPVHNEFCVAVVTGDTNGKEREWILAEYNAGRIHVLVNCLVLSEGTDLPRTDCVVMTRPTCNANLYIQMVGRGLRLCSGKQYCLVLDFVDRSHATSRSLVTYPSLFQFQPNGDITGPGGVPGPRVEMVEDIDAQELKVHCVDVNGHPGYGLSWISICDNIFAINSSKLIVLLRISPHDATLGHLEYWTPFIYKMTRTCWSKRGVLRLDAEGCITEGRGQCDDEAIDMLIPKLLQFLHRMDYLTMVQADAPWRRRRPATPMQISYLVSILQEIDWRAREYTSSSVFLHSVSSGKVCDMISKYKILKKLGMGLPTMASLLHG